MEKVYVVMIDWSTEDWSDVDIYIYNAYEKALEKYKELIKDEMNPDNSWVGNIEWENGIPQDHYELNSKDGKPKENLYWHIEDTWDYNYHTFIDLRIMEVQ